MHWWEWWPVLLVVLIGVSLGLFAAHFDTEGFGPDGPPGRCRCKGYCPCRSRPGCDTGPL